MHTSAPDGRLFSRASEVLLVRPDQVPEARAAGLRPSTPMSSCVPLVTRDRVVGKPPAMGLRRRCMIERLTVLCSSGQTPCNKNRFRAGFIRCWNTKLQTNAAAIARACCRKAHSANSRAPKRGTLMVPGGKTVAQKLNLSSGNSLCCGYYRDSGVPNYILDHRGEVFPSVRLPKLLFSYRVFG